MQTRKRSYLLLVIGAALSVAPSNAQVSSGTTYTLVARHSGQFLDVLGAATANGSPVGQSTGHGGSNQQWLIESLGSGQYRLTGVGSGKPLDINQASTAVANTMPNSVFSRIASPTLRANRAAVSDARPAASRELVEEAG